jgi:hypothetical protein
MQPALSSAQLRALSAGDRVSRIAGPGVVHTARVASTTATQIVVQWPDATTGRYLRETGRRAGCPGEVLRQAEPVGQFFQGCPGGCGRKIDATSTTPCAWCRKGFRRASAIRALRCA